MKQLIHFWLTKNSKIVYRKSFYFSASLASPWPIYSCCSGLVHWEDPEESGGEGGERGDRDGEYM